MTHALTKVVRSLMAPDKDPHTRAIETRKGQLDEARALTAEALYRVAELKAEVRERRATLARVHHAHRVAERVGDDLRVRRLDLEQDEVREALALSETSLDAARVTAERAESTLRELYEEIGTLERTAHHARLAAHDEALQRRLARLETARGV